MHFPSGIKDKDKKRLVAQLSELDANYTKGLPEYVRNSKRLLKDAQDGKSAQSLSMIATDA